MPKQSLKVNKKLRAKMEKCGGESKANCPMFSAAEISTSHWRYQRKQYSIGLIIFIPVKGSHNHLKSVISATFLSIHYEYSLSDHIFAHRQRKPAHQEYPGGPQISTCLVLCTQPLPFGGYFRSHLSYHYRQQPFALLLRVGMDTSCFQFPIRPCNRTPPSPSTAFALTE